jgi:putative ABC transport system permease protein
MSERLLRTVSRLVPRARREEWVREWRAELAVRPLRSPLDAMPLLEDAMGYRFVSPSSGGSGHDLRQALRVLVRYRAFSAVVVCTLALGIGASISMLAVVRGVLLRPFPYADADEIALVALAFGHGGEERPIAASGPEFLELRAENRAFAGIAGYSPSDVNVGNVAEPVRVPAASVTPNFLSVLGVPIGLGRDFAERDGEPGAPGVVLIAHGLWQSVFGGDRGVVGRTITINGSPATVAGVLPASFEFPAGEARLLRPLRLDPADPGGRSSHWIMMVGRLAPNVDVASARARTDQLVARWTSLFPERHGPGVGHPVRIDGLREATTGNLKTPLLLLSAAVALVLLVACVNVANLLLVRGEDRQRELGIRTALGAGRGALLRQLVFEHGALAAAGGALGVGLAWAFVRVLPILAGGVIPTTAPVRLDLPLLGGAALVTMVAGLLFGLAPAVWAARAEPLALFRDGSRGGTAGPRRIVFRRAMVIAEVAMAVALLAGAGVLGRGFVRLLAVEPGFDATGVVTMEFSLSDALYPEPQHVASFHAELDRRLAALPGVVAAGAIRSLPLAGEGYWESLTVLGRPTDDAGNWTVQYQVASAGFFAALRIPLLEGRAFRAGDDAAATPVAIVNRAAAQALFEDEPALGQRVQHGFGSPENPNPVLTVVGVVGDVHQEGLDQPATPQLYVPRAQAGAVYGGLGSQRATVAVRSELEPAAAIAAVRGVLRDMDAQLPVANVATMDARVSRSVGDRRLVALLMGGFAALALVLGALGIYGLMAYIVARRTRELGIRLALGARRTRVVGRVVGEAATLAGIGCMVGVAAALAAGDVLESLVFGVSARDPVALLAAPLLLLAVASCAALLPARKASSVDPVSVLREE